MDEVTLGHWLELALTPQVGPKTFLRLRSALQCCETILSLNHYDLTQLGLSEPSIEHILALPKKGFSSSVDELLRWREGEYHHIITPEDSSFPRRLKEISTPPPFLCIKGDVDALSLPQMAIVGSRYPSQAGIQQAMEFAEALTEQGWVITSGLAKGVDGYAHRGCLQAGGKTVAVLGSGINKIYPKSHARLADEVAQQGALVSEWPLNMPAHAHQFPQRNRIVSGLSYGVLVVEAGLKSGSLITARQALEQNREIFAIPGSIQNPQKEGCHYLIQQGAHLTQSANDITALLMPQLEHMADRSGNSKMDTKDDVFQDLSPEEYKVMSRLDYEGLTVDEISRLTNHPVFEVSSILMALELSGFIRQDQGLFVRV